ncbi:MAG: threonine/homoserine/homoserine lactone efflux protein [Maribacter sp.]|jgi:threonine/homoserine/homoserine lactone efflux protein
MNLILEGMALGLVLSVSIGPIFFALVQTSIKQGLASGVFVATGIWISDFLFILFTFLGLSQLTELKDDPTFALAFGLIGGSFLFIFGVILFFKKSISLEALSAKPKRESSIISLWTQGFLVNTFNPFTIFFWLTTMTDGVVGRSFGMKEVILFFGAIMGTIMITDFLKAYFADKIRHKLKPIHLKWFGWLSGIIVMAFGIMIISRGFSGF